MKSYLKIMLFWLSSFIFWLLLDLINFDFALHEVGLAVLAGYVMGDDER